MQGYYRRAEAYKAIAEKVSVQGLNARRFYVSAVKDLMACYQRMWQSNDFTCRLNRYFEAIVIALNNSQFLKCFGILKIFLHY